MIIMKACWSHTHRHAYPSTNTQVTLFIEGRSVGIGNTWAASLDGYCVCVLYKKAKPKPKRRKHSSSFCLLCIKNKLKIVSATTSDNKIEI